MAPQQDGTDYRIEHDSMGKVRVPAWAKWRAQTQRAVENFPISGTPIERELIGALAAIKGAAAAGGAGVALLICYVLCRLALDRRRLAAWESAWSLTGPRWTTRR